VRAQLGVTTRASFFFGVAGAVLQQLRTFGRVMHALHCMLPASLVFVSEELLCCNPACLQLQLQCSFPPPSATRRRRLLLLLSLSLS
jgi:hypothetical protein